MNFEKITNVEFEDVDMADYPKFCDAFISYAEIDGRPATETELDKMMENYNWFYDQLTDWIH